MISLSVIIPSNEPLDILKQFLPGIISAATQADQTEFILINACKEGDSKAYCQSLGVTYEAAEIPMRSRQLNQGAALATSSNLFFLHLDSIPPLGYDKSIRAAIATGANSGCFQMVFSPTTKFLSFFAFFTRFHWRTSRGGDQGLFVKQSVFNQVGGYDDSLVIMEDMAICHKLETHGGFEILTGPIITSARKYQTFGQWRLQAIYIFVTILFWMGMPNAKLNRIYKRLLGK